MKKEIIESIMFLNILLSGLLYKFSGGRIVTKTTRLSRQIIKESNDRRIKKMQQKLDEMHAKLRGWTSMSDPCEDVEEDAIRDILLNEEFKRTREAIKSQTL